MQEYYEELWERLPPGLRPSDFELRLAFLLANVRAGERVLDLGCGEGHFTAALAEAGTRPIGLEVAARAIQRASALHPGLEFRLSPIAAALPFEENSFEVVWAGEVIEHVADTARWLSEARRVLVPRGRVLLSTPSHGRLRLLLAGIERFSEPLGDHLHLYTSGSMSDLLKTFGFHAVAVTKQGGPPGLRRVLLARGSR